MKTKLVGICLIILLVLSLYLTSIVKHGNIFDDIVSGLAYQLKGNNNDVQTNGIQYLWDGDHQAITLQDEREMESTIEGQDNGFKNTSLIKEDLNAEEPSEMATKETEHVVGRPINSISAIPDEQCTMEWRVRHVREECDKLNVGVNMTLSDTVQFVKQHPSYLFDDFHKIFYCPIGKVASTMFRNALIQSSPLWHPNQKNNFTSVGIKFASSYTDDEISYRMKNYMKLMFMRHPFDKLVSAYNHKLILGNNYVGNKFTDLDKLTQQYFNKTLTDPDKEMTFYQFIHLISKEPENFFDLHWMNVIRRCHPCEINFDYIVRLETFDEDFPVVASRLGNPDLSHTINNTWRKISDKLADATDNFRTLSDDTMRGIFDNYGQDIDIFGYTWSKKDGAGCAAVSEGGRCC